MTTESTSASPGLPADVSIVLGTRSAGFPSLLIPLVWCPEETALFNVAGEGFPFWWRGHLFRHRPGGYTDGMSDPRFLHILSDADPFGWAFPGALPHDGGYHDDLEIWIQPNPLASADPLQHPGGYWQKFQCDKATCDQIIFDLLVVLARGLEVKVMEARAIYEAVHLGGLEAYNQGRERAAVRTAQADPDYPKTEVAA